MDSWQAEFGESFRGARVLVTGGTGFLGWHLCRALGGLGAVVTGASRSASSGSVAPGTRPMLLDLTDRESVLYHLGRDRYELVFHLAGNVSSRSDRELLIPMLNDNLVGAIQLLDAVSTAGCQRMVFVGSSEEPVYPQAATSPYAAAKSAARAYAMMFHTLFRLPVVALRLFLAYGPRQDLVKLVPYAISTLLAGRNPRVLSSDKICDAVYVEDAIRAMLAAAIAPKEVEGQTFDVGNGTGLTVRDVVIEIADLIGSPGRPEFACVGEYQTDPGAIADVSPTGAALGWRPTWELRDALQETINWYGRVMVSKGVA